MQVYKLSQNSYLSILPQFLLASLPPGGVLYGCQARQTSVLCQKGEFFLVCSHPSFFSSCVLSCCLSGTGHCLSGERPLIACLIFCLFSEWVCWFWDSTSFTARAEQEKMANNGCSYGSFRHRGLWDHQPSPGLQRLTAALARSSGCGVFAVHLLACHCGHIPSRWLVLSSACKV